MNKKNTLGKKERLKSKKLIGKLFEEGKSIKKYPFRLVYLIQDKNSLLKNQASFSVPKRNFKKAVDRNRIKRLMKESARKINVNNKRIAFVYIGEGLPTYEIVNNSIINLLSKI